MDALSIPLQEGLKLIQTSSGQLHFYGFNFSAASGRSLFIQHKDNLTCCECGLVATHWRLDHFKAGKGKNQNPGAVLNLYGLRDDHQVMFTQDHIHPKSLGGSDRLENLRVMCEPCNKARGNHLTIFEMVDTLKQQYIGLNTRNSKEYKKLSDAFGQLPGYRKLRTLVAMAVHEFKRLAAIPAKVSKAIKAELKREKSNHEVIHNTSLFQKVEEHMFFGHYTQSYSDYFKHVNKLRSQGLSILEIFDRMSIQAQKPLYV